MDTSKNELVRMAIVGCRKQIADLQDAIKTYEAMLEGAPAIAPLKGITKPAPVKASGEDSAAPKKRRLSPAGRRRIAAATKKRWAEFHANKAKASQTATATT